MEADKYSKEVLNALSWKVATDIFGQDYDCLDIAFEDVHCTLKETEHWDDGSYLASRFCFNSGDDMCTTIVDTFECAKTYAYLLSDMGLDVFKRLGKKKRLKVGSSL